MSSRASRQPRAPHVQGRVWAMIGLGGRQGGWWHGCRSRYTPQKTRAKIRTGCCPQASLELRQARQPPSASRRRTEALVGLGGRRNAGWHGCRILAVISSEEGRRRNKTVRVQASISRETPRRCMPTAVCLEARAGGTLKCVPHRGNASHNSPLHQKTRGRLAASPPWFLGSPGELRQLYE